MLGVREEARRLHDGPPLVWTILYLSAVLALITVCELHVGQIHDALDAVDLPGRCVEGMLMQEIPAPCDLFLVKRGDEVEVYDGRRSRSEHGVCVVGPGQVQSLPSAEMPTHRRSNQHIWLLLAKQPPRSLALCLNAEIPREAVLGIVDRYVECETRKNMAHFPVSNHFRHPRR